MGKKKLLNRKNPNRYSTRLGHSTFLTLEAHKGRWICLHCGKEKKKKHFQSVLRGNRMSSVCNECKAKKPQTKPKYKRVNPFKMSGSELAENFKERT